MDVEHLIGTMIQGALVGRGKRSRGAHRFLRSGGSPFLNASTLLTVGGLVWGVVETMQQQTAAGAGAPASIPTPPPSGPPGSPVAQAPPPPIPGSEVPAGGAAASEQQPAEPIPEGAAKLVRLMVSAARADGTLADAERAKVLERAREAGAEALVGDEIDHPTPLARIVEGITDAQQRADLYVLAYGIVRADESISGSEQIYLAQLAALLQLPPQAVERLERDAAARIDEAAQGA